MIKIASLQFAKSALFQEAENRIAIRLTQRVVTRNVLQKDSILVYEAKKIKIP